MSKLLKYGASIFALSLLASAGTAQAADPIVDLIVNGDFTSPNVGVGGYSQNAVVPGWTDTAETNGDVEVGYSPVYGFTGCESTIGCQNAEVNNYTLGNVEQTVNNLVVGQTYTFSVDYGERAGAGAQQLDILFGGVQIAEGLTDGTEANSEWAASGPIYVVATSSSEVLDFQSVDVGGNNAEGNDITNVSLIGPVPEPATWAMMLTGFAMMGLALRRRNRAARVTFG